ncbi:hypothetical protein BLIN101_03383, partial [Brevibacterium linens]
MYNAEFNRRSPLRFSRNLTTFPDDAGIGQTPANFANAASER